MALGRPKKPRSNPDANTDTHSATTGYEAELWQMADAFEERHALLESEREQGADPEDSDEYRAENLFWVPPEARWTHLKAQAKQPTIGQLVDECDGRDRARQPGAQGRTAQGLWPRRTRQTAAPMTAMARVEPHRCNEIRQRLLIAIAEPIGRWNSTISPSSILEGERGPTHRCAPRRD